MYSTASTWAMSGIFIDRRALTRPVWRLENGRAVLVAYEIYRGPKNQYGRIAGVFGRSEFRAEITLAIA